MTYIPYKLQEDFTTDSQVVSVDIYLTTITNITSSPYAYTLASGIVINQKKKIIMLSSIGAVVITGNFEGATTTLTLSSGQTTELIWSGSEWKTVALYENIMPIITDILYADLLVLSQNEEMIIGYYRITDFATSQLIPNTISVKTGIAEPLIVFATSKKTLDKKAISALWPQDYIEYDLEDITIFNPSDGSSKGSISFRKDTIINVSTYFDWRNFVWRRWETVLNNGTYISLTDPGGGRAHIDFYTFSNNIAVDTNVFIVAGNGNAISTTNTHIGDTSSNTIFGNNQSDVYFGSNMLDNTFSNYMNFINAGAYTNNIIAGKNFKYNNIGSYFQTTSIGSNFQLNNIKNNFGSNIIGNYFQYNNIENDVAGLTILNNFVHNNICATFGGVDFTASTLVYNPYTKHIVIHPDNSFVLYYLNDANTIIYAAPNA